MCRTTVLLIVVVLGISLVPPTIAVAAWDFVSPSSGATLSKTMPVSAYGHGEGAATTLIIKVYRGTEELINGTGNWNGSGLWAAGAGVPSGGWGDGAAEIRLWKAGDEVGAPMITQDVTF